MPFTFTFTNTFKNKGKSRRSTRYAPACRLGAE
jgi:hypothetical protein